MGDSFDALEFGWYLKRHWRKAAVCCAIAVALTLVGSLLVPKRYTATATIVIQPPGGMDPRGTTAVSPVYLESLKTYELMASSDSLFLEALDRLKLRERYAWKSIESLKRSVLEVAKPVNTRLIQISATLDDPKEAQALAQYLAGRTVALSRSLGERAGTDAAREAQTVFDGANARFTAAQKAMEVFVAKQADGAADSQLESASELSYQASRDLNKAEQELAGLLAQIPPGGAAVPVWLTTEIAAARARIATLTKQSQILERTVGEVGRRTEHLKQMHDSMESELKSARAGYDVARGKLDDIRSSPAGHGESLEILDPGIVPQRPSFPNKTLNILVALLVSSAASVGWLAARFGYEKASRSRTEREFRLR